jgi:hypothetical protein
MFTAKDRITSDVLNDPELQEEFNSLETEEDKQDFLDALEALEEVEREGSVSWDRLKNDLGLR